MEFAVQTVTLFALLYLVPWFGVLHDEARLVAAFVLSILASALLSFAVDVFKAPTELFAELQTKTSELETRLTPRLHVSLPEPDGITHLDFGSTSETRGGRLQSVATAAGTLLCLHVKPASESPPGAIYGKLTGAWRMTPNGKAVDLGIIEAVQLPWSRDNQDHQYVWPGPSEISRLYIGAILPSGSVRLNKPLKELPFEYHQLMIEAGEYLLRIQLTCDGPGQDTYIKLVTDKADAATGSLPKVSAKAIVLDSNAARRLFSETEGRAQL